MLLVTPQDVGSPRLVVSAGVAVGTECDQVGGAVVLAGAPRADVCSFQRRGLAAHGAAMTGLEEDLSLNVHRNRRTCAHPSASSVTVASSASSLASSASSEISESSTPSLVSVASGSRAAASRT